MSFLFLFHDIQYLLTYSYGYQAITYEPERLPNLYGKGGEMIKYIGTYVQSIVSPSILSHTFSLFLNFYFGEYVTFWELIIN